MKQLTKKEKMFCRLYALSGDGGYAARAAGYKNPQQKVHALLSRSDITDEVGRISGENRARMRDMSLSGLWRLAFGDVSDAVALCFDEAVTRDKIRSLNLYNVSEIRHQKDRSVEIKFFDRVKALEKLREALGADDTPCGGSGLIEALASAARRSGGQDED